jgi:hypothetical protein
MTYTAWIVAGHQQETVGFPQRKTTAKVNCKLRSQ